MHHINGRVHRLIPIQITIQRKQHLPRIYGQNGLMSQTCSEFEPFVCTSLKAECPVKNCLLPWFANYKNLMRTVT